MNCMDEPQDMHYEWFHESFSRPIFKHAYSQKESLESITRYIFDNCLTININKKNQYALSALILDLYLIDQLTRSLGTIGIFTSNGSLSANGSMQYQVIQCSSASFSRLINALEDAKLIERKMGAKGHSTKIRASKALIDISTKFNLTLDNYIYPSPFPILYKDSDDNKVNMPKKTAKALGLEAIGKYNKLLCQTNITVGSNSLYAFEKISKRQFSDKDGECNGRLYGPIWQRLPKVLRSYIKINGNSTVEIDIKSTHPLIAYALNGHDLTAYVKKSGSPYHIKFWQDSDNQYDRMISKHSLLVMLNASSESEAVKAITKHINQEVDLATGERFLNQRMVELKAESGLNNVKEVLECLVLRNSAIRDHMFVGAWAYLNRIESDICLNVIKYFAEKNIAILTVHDSFIIEERCKEELERVIVQEIQNVLKIKYDDKSQIVSEEPKHEGMTKELLNKRLVASRVVKGKTDYRNDKLRFIGSMV